MISHVTLQKFYEATKIPFQLFSNNLPIQNFASADFQPNPAASILSCAENVSNTICYTVSPEYLFYGLVPIHNSSDYLIVGPAMAFECTRKQAQNILTSLQQPTNRTDELLRWFHTIPLCDIHRFRGILGFLDHILNGSSEENVGHIPYKANSSPMPTITTGPSFIEHVSDLLERQMLSYVEYGNLNALEKVFKDWETQAGELPSVASDAIRSFKNIFISATAIVSRAAIKGGLNYDTGLTLASSYFMQIEMLDSYTDIFNLFKLMFLDFTGRTARCRSFLSDSSVVNKICKDVQAHLYEKITTTNISERLKMNCSYLCRHFKQETGKTITEFINEVKIEEAIRLLETTEMPLIQISTQLGFSSQNYFQTVFKKITGMTPVECRNKD